MLLANLFIIDILFIIIKNNNLLFIKLNYCWWIIYIISFANQSLPVTQLFIFYKFIIQQFLKTMASNWDDEFDFEDLDSKPKKTNK